MNVTQKQMYEINKVQLKIFKEFVDVCNKLGLNYYAIHGTLLGALRYKGFFPFDDDIDVAMPRKDYNRFIEEGQEYFSNNIFIQSNKSEKEYPLVFAKLRDSNTTFLQTNLDNLNINKGIYIDIFPIDNFTQNKIIKRWLEFKGKIYCVRVSSRLKSSNKSVMRKIKILITKFFCPNWYIATKRNSELYCNIQDNDNCIIHGGKNSEKGIPFDLFGQGVQLDFEGMKINAPEKYKEYLKIIYDDYNNYFPAQKYMVSDNLVEISARIVDTNKSYKEYN